MLCPPMEPIRRLARHPVVKQQGKFFVVGVICTVIDFGIFDALTYRWHLAPVVAHTVSFVFSCVASFVLNRIWTFELEGRVVEGLRRGDDADRW